MIQDINQIANTPVYDDNWFLEQERKAFINLNAKPKKPDGLISIGYTQRGTQNDHNYIFTRGELSCISAPSKSFKSTFKSHLQGVFFRGTSEQFPDMNGHRKENDCIIDVDTEQGEYFAWHTFNRTKRLAEKDISKYYFPYKLRHLTPSQRVMFIDMLLQKVDNPAIIFIDGIADLIEDSNDLVMSNEIVSKIMRWTDELNCHVCVIIHNAYGTVKPTGHLGSATIKKVETCLSIQPTEHDPCIYKCVHQYSRGAKFDDFFFEYDKSTGYLRETDVL